MRCHLSGVQPHVVIGLRDSVHSFAFGLRVKRRERREWRRGAFYMDGVLQGESAGLHNGVDIS